MEKCPLCDTERVAGEALCSNSKCGYEFSIPSQPKKSEEQTDDEWLEEQKQDTPPKTDDDTLTGEEKKQESDNITCYYIEDGITSVQEKPSANGTKVNGKDIRGQGKLELENGNVIEVAGGAEVTFHLDSNGHGKIILPDNIEILFEDTPKTVGRDNFYNFLNSLNLDPFEVSRKQFTISRE